MKKKIINNLNNVTITGNYNGGDNITNNCDLHMETSSKQKKHDRTVFISYNWKDKQIVDKIDIYLSKIPGIIVKRDIRDIGSWESIRVFMENIRKQDYAVLIISDSYLKSKNCMFEVTEIMKEQEYRNRIFPAVVEQRIFDPLVRTEYIKYWQQECNKLENAMRDMEAANASELCADIKCYKNIAASIGEFLRLVANINNPKIEEIELQIEKMIQKYL